MSVLTTLLKKELTDSLRDRRTLVMMILVPILLYPGLLALIGGVLVAGKERLAQEQLTVAVASADAEAFLASVAAPPHTKYVRMERARAETALRGKEVWAIVDAPHGAHGAIPAGQQGSVTVVYTKRHDRSIEALERVKRVLDGVKVKALEDRLGAAGLPRTFAEPLRIETYDLDFQQDLGPLVASRLLPVILIMMLFMGALYPAIDVTAGEKERGTLETLLVAPVRPLEVMAAKYLTVAAISSIATLVNLAVMAFTFGFGLNLGDGMRVTMGFSFGQVATLVLCLVPSAFMVSGVSLAIASLARNFKEGQSLMTPLSLVGTVPGMLTMMPGIDLNAGTAAIPLLNVALLVRAVILGSAQPLHVAITFASVALCSLGAVALAANAFQSETLRFGGSESWRELFRGNRSSGPRVNP